MARPDAVLVERVAARAARLIELLSSRGIGSLRFDAVCRDDEE